MESMKCLLILMPPGKTRTIKCEMSILIEFWWVQQHLQSTKMWTTPWLFFCWSSDHDYQIVVYVLFQTVIITAEGHTYRGNTWTTRSSMISHILRIYKKFMWNKLQKAAKMTKKDSHAITNKYHLPYLTTLI